MKTKKKHTKNTKRKNKGIGDAYRKKQDELINAALKAYPSVDMVDLLRAAIEDNDKKSWKELAAQLAKPVMPRSPTNFEEAARKLDKMYKKSVESYEEYDTINSPKHYTEHPSSVECIEIVEHMNFCLGNAIKYIWRSDKKNGIEDLRKASWYIEREIDRQEEIKLQSNEEY